MDTLSSGSHDSLLGAIASYGNISYAVGNSGGHWVTRRSQDSGETWTTVEDFATGGALGVATDRVSGAVYAAGRLVGDHDWVIRKSANGGSTWVQIEDLTTEINGGRPVVQKIAVDGLGNVSAVGRSAQFSAGPALLRRSEDGGTHWETINVGGGMEFAQNLVAGPTGQLFVAGLLPDPATGAARWYVRYSPNGKTGWVTADLVTTPFTGSFVVHGAIAKDGRVVMVGSGFDAEGNGRLLVRQASLADPTNWTQLAEYRPKNEHDRFGTAAGQGATFAIEGDLVVAGGQTQAGSDRADGIAVQIRSSGKLKVTDVVPHPGIASEQLEVGPGVGAITTHLDGSVLAGHVIRNINYYDWVIRKQDCK